MELTLDEIYRYINCQLAEQRIEISEELEDADKALVEQLDSYLDDFAKDYIAKNSIDEKAEILLIARLMKGLLTVKLPDEVLEEVKTRCATEGTTIHEQLAKLVEAGLNSTCGDMADE